MQPECTSNPTTATMPRRVFALREGKSDKLAKHLTMSGKSTFVGPYKVEDRFNLFILNGKEETIGVSQKNNVTPE